MRQRSLENGKWMHHEQGYLWRIGLTERSNIAFVGGLLLEPYFDGTSSKAFVM